MEQLSLIALFCGMSLWLNARAVAAAIIPGDEQGVYTIKGGGHYCEGGPGAYVLLHGSTKGFSYQLLHEGYPIGHPQPGTGDSINFGLQLATGIYTVSATNTNTNSSLMMKGNVTIGTIAPPSSYLVSYYHCANGKDILLNSSQIGVTYQLYKGGTPVGSAFQGTEGPLQLNSHNIKGHYTIVATKNGSGCSATMVGAADVDASILTDVNPANTDATSTLHATR
jgi:hypothetical protein